jgi:hypothetical protein
MRFQLTGVTEFTSINIVLIAEDVSVTIVDVSLKTAVIDRLRAWNASGSTRPSRRRVLLPG